MPEYLAPGVYVTVIESSAKPIEGVSTSTAGLTGDDLVAQLRRLAENVRPEWTDHNQSDPGVALVELFAFLAESLLLRSRNTVRFSPGQLLGPDDLSSELNYTRPPGRSDSAPCAGIVCGLEIQVSTDECGSAVIVTPGYAIDGRGRDIILKTSVSLPLTGALASAFVVVRWKFDVKWTNVLHPSLVCDVLVVDAPKSDDFPLGRLDYGAQGWRPRVIATSSC